MKLKCLGTTLLTWVTARLGVQKGLGKNSRKVITYKLYLNFAMSKLVLIKLVKLMKMKKLRNFGIFLSSRKCLPFGQNSIF